MSFRGIVEESRATTQNFHNHDLDSSIPPRLTRGHYGMTRYLFKNNSRIKAMPLCWSTQTFLNETTASGAVSVANLRPARVEFRNDVCEARGTGFFLSTFFARSKKVDIQSVEIKPRCHSEGEAEESHNVNSVTVSGL